MRFFTALSGTNVGSATVRKSTFAPVPIDAGGVVGLGEGTDAARGVRASRCCAACC